MVWRSLSASPCLPEMSTDSPHYSKVEPRELSIGVVCASFNPSLCEALLSRVLDCLEENGKLQNLIVERVPGSNEIPSAVDLILDSSSLDSIIGLGVVIKGSTSHHQLVAELSGHALQNLSLQYHTPVINGIVVTDNVQAAEERITGPLDRGSEFANAAIEMAALKKKWTRI